MSWLLEKLLTGDMISSRIKRDGGATRDLRNLPILQCYRWFPHEMTSEERAQKFHADDVSLPRSG